MSLPLWNSAQVRRMSLPLWNSAQDQRMGFPLWNSAQVWRMGLPLWNSAQVRRMGFPLWASGHNQKRNFLQKAADRTPGLHLPLGMTGQYLNLYFLWRVSSYRCWRTASPAHGYHPPRIILSAGFYLLAQMRLPASVLALPYTASQIKARWQALSFSSSWLSVFFVSS